MIYEKLSRKEKMYVNFLLDSFSGEKAYKKDFVGVRNSNHLLSSISSLKPEITIKAFSELMKNKEFVKGMLVNVRTGSERGHDLSNTFLRNVVCRAFYREFEYDKVPSEEMIKIREEFLAVLDEVIKEQPLQAIKLIPTLEVYEYANDKMFESLYKSVYDKCVSGEDISEIVNRVSVKSSERTIGLEPMFVVTKALKDANHPEYQTCLSKIRAIVTQSLDDQFIKNLDDRYLAFNSIASAMDKITSKEITEVIKIAKQMNANWLGEDLAFYNKFGKAQEHYHYGWSLREIGKVDINNYEKILEAYQTKYPGSEYAEESATILASELNLDEALTFINDTEFEDGMVIKSKCNLLGPERVYQVYDADVRKIIPDAFKNPSERVESFYRGIAEYEKYMSYQSSLDAAHDRYDKLNPLKRFLIRKAQELRDSISETFEPMPDSDDVPDYISGVDRLYGGKRL